MTSLRAPAALIRYRGEVRKYFSRRLCTYPNDVDDLTQEVFVRFLSAEVMNELRDPLGYLLAIARHVFADFLQDRKKWQCGYYEDLVAVCELSEEVNSRAAGDPAESLSLREEVDALLRQLPRSQRAVLLAHEHDGYTYQEVATRLGFTKQTVEKYLVMAKASIRAYRRQIPTSHVPSNQLAIRAAHTTEHQRKHASDQAANALESPYGRTLTMRHKSHLR